MSRPVWEIREKLTYYDMIRYTIWNEAQHTAKEAEDARRKSQEMMSALNNQQKQQAAGNQSQHRVGHAARVGQAARRRNATHSRRVRRRR